VTVLASEGVTVVSVSARTASSVVVLPTPTDPMESRKSTRDLRAQSAAKEYSNEVRGGGRDPCVRRPGTGPGQWTARSKFCRAPFMFDKPQFFTFFAKTRKDNKVKTGHFRFLSLSLSFSLFIMGLCNAFNTLKVKGSRGQCMVESEACGSQCD